MLFISANVQLRTFLSICATLLKFSSWNTTISPSDVSCISSSIPVNPSSSAAALNASSVFSGYNVQHPLCAHILGIFLLLPSLKNFVCTSLYIGLFHSIKRSIISDIAMLIFSIVVTLSFVSELSFTLCINSLTS